MREIKSKELPAVKPDGQVLFEVHGQSLALLKRSLMGLERIKADQEALRINIAIEEQRLVARPAAAVVEQRLPAGETPCFGCAELIPKAARICHWCKTVQPDHLAEVTSLQLYLANRIDEPYFLTELLARLAYGEKSEVDR